MHEVYSNSCYHYDWWIKLGTLERERGGWLDASRNFWSFNEQPEPAYQTEEKDPFVAWYCSFPNGAK